MTALYRIVSLRCGHGVNLQAVSMAENDLYQPGYTLWLDRWPDGYVAQECNRNGSGCVLVSGATRADAIDAIIDFLTENGGTAFLADNGKEAHECHH